MDIMTQSKERCQKLQVLINNILDYTQTLLYL